MEKALNFLQRYHNNLPNDWLFEKREVVARMLEEYSQEQSSLHWIPVGERLPDHKEHGKVLIHREVNSCQAALAFSIYDASMVKHCNRETTYWMPLLNPPAK